MDRNVQRLEPLDGGSAYGVASQHRVLRNTYWLLALSMLPTVLGAWIGVQTGIVMHMTPGMSMILFFAGAYGLMFAVNATKNSAAGVFVMLAFTFFMGLMLSRLLGYVLGFANGTNLIMTAFMGTAGVFFGMATLATVVKRDLSGVARFASVGMMIAIAACVMNLFMASTALMLTISVVVMAISSLFIMIDVKRVIDGGETNYITAALAIYIDLYNLFQSLLMILSSVSGNRR